MNIKLDVENEVSRGDKVYVHPLSKKVTNEAKKGYQLWAGAIFTESGDDLVNVSYSKNIVFSDVEVEKEIVVGEVIEPRPTPSVEIMINNGDIYVEESDAEGQEIGEEGYGDGLRPEEERGIEESDEEE